MHHLFLYPIENYLEEDFKLFYVQLIIAFVVLQFRGNHFKSAKLRTQAKAQIKCFFFVLIILSAIYSI